MNAGQGNGMGDRGPDRQGSMIAWGVAAVLAVALFLVLGIAQGARWFSAASQPPVVATSTSTAAPTVTPSATPSATPTAGVRPVTPGLEVAAAGITPGWEPTAPAEATMQAVVLNVLANLPTATPSAAPDTAATATLQAQRMATAVADAVADVLDEEGVQGGGIALWLSAFTAITALVGLVSSLLLSWRKERRDVDQARAELAKTQLEVEKLRRELAK